tara:strand:- start:331 stop:495 length:165 start_codon:yes stop_codon:yes gene_type:complete
MPIYDFECEKCGYKFEDLVNQGVAKVKCTKCGDVSSKKISAPSLVGFDKFGRSK